MSEAPALPALARRARLLCLASSLALILLYSLHSLFLAAAAPNPLLWLVQTLPLAAFLPALARNRPRAYQWLCFLILAYFINGVLAAFDPRERIKGLTEILLCLAVFASAIVFVNAYRKLPRRRPG